MMIFVYNQQDHHVGNEEVSCPSCLLIGLSGGQCSNHILLESHCFLTPLLSPFCSPLPSQHLENGTESRTNCDFFFFFLPPSFPFYFLDLGTQKFRSQSIKNVTSQSNFYQKNNPPKKCFINESLKLAESHSCGELTFSLEHLLPKQRNTHTLYFHLLSLCFSLTDYLEYR